MRIEKLLLTLAWMSVLLWIAKCSNPNQGPSVGTDVVSMQRVLGRLNGEAIVEKDFDDFLKITQGELSEDPQPAPRRELFREFLTRRLLWQEAKKAGIEVERVRVEEYAKQWTGREIEETEEFFQPIHEFLAVQKFLSEQIRSEISVDLSETLKYYEQHSDQFVVEDQTHVLEILTVDRAEALRIRRELESGDISDFKQRAKRDSVGVTASKGGDLGFFRRGELPEDFEKVIFALKPGELSEPFKSDYGFHIFLIEEWIPRHPQKFFEVREQIFELLIAEKERVATEVFLNDMLERASIEIYDPSLQFFEEDRSSHEKTNEQD